MKTWGGVLPRLLLFFHDEKSGDGHGKSGDGHEKSGDWHEKSGGVLSNLLLILLDEKNRRWGSIWNGTAGGVVIRLCFFFIGVKIRRWE